LIDDRLLEESMAEARDIWLGTLPDDSDIHHTFSKEFEDKMAFLLGRRTVFHSERHAGMARMSKVVIVAVLISCIIFTVIANRSELVEVSIRVYDGVWESVAKRTSKKITEEKDFRIDYLPDKMTLLQETGSEDSYEFYYEEENESIYYNPVNRKTLFIQIWEMNYPKGQRGVHHLYGSIKPEVTEVLVNGSKGYFVNQGGVGDYKTMFWAAEYYYIEMESNLPYDEMLKIAEGIVVY